MRSTFANEAAGTNPVFGTPALLPVAGMPRLAVLGRRWSEARAPRTIARGALVRRAALERCVVAILGGMAGYDAEDVVATWRIPKEGSPDMGGVSRGGWVLWRSGRSAGEVDAIPRRDGGRRARIPVGAGPQGPCVWAQPGRRSLEQTGSRG